MKPALLLTLLLIFLSACAPALTATPVSTPSLPAAESPTTQTATLAPPTITPLPTIPTFTPTFDARTIVTATPAPKAVCPKENSGVKVEFKPDLFQPPLFDIEEVLRFLNNGGHVGDLLKSVQGSQFVNYAAGDIIRVQDVTNDNVPEILLMNFEQYTPTRKLHIFHCENGKYVDYVPSLEYFGFTISFISIQDLNKDQIPEIVLLDRGCNGIGCYHLYIAEWDEENFVEINSSADQEISGVEKVKFINDRIDPLLDVQVTGGLPDIGVYPDVYPWREETILLRWNGTSFISGPIEYAPSVFRFQAIQDGDQHTSEGNYQEAIEMYQVGIFDTKLEWWSPERHEATRMKLGDEGFSRSNIPASGTPDPTEYPRLAAYAYYRMVILHTYLDQSAEAQTKYATLQEKFPAGNPGHPYVEMASAFWDTYQSIGKMYNACAAAIAYADAHPNILIPLGSNYHGWQSHQYVPADVCPFR
jgi:hypothetical protein